MKRGTKTQLALLFFALDCFIGVATALIVNSIVTNQIIHEAQERVREHLSSARWVYESKVRDIEKVIWWTSVGMLYVGMMESKYAHMKERLILLFFLFSMSGMLFAFAISFALSWKILKKRFS